MLVECYHKEMFTLGVLIAGLLLIFADILYQMLRKDK